MLPLVIVVSASIILAKEIFAEDEQRSSALESSKQINDYLFEDDETNSLNVSLSDCSVSDATCVDTSFDDSSIEESSSVFDESCSFAQLCKLIGPIVQEDEEETRSTSTIDNKTLPSNLEFSKTIELPVGYLRLRKAFLSSKSQFWTDSILKNALGYEEVKCTEWEHHHNELIGRLDLPSNISHEDLIGATRETSYLMPAGRLVPANMAYESCTLKEYNDNFFTLCMSTRTPDVPFGKRFIAETKIIVVRTGKNSCQMICSVEAEFPNGPPLGMKGQIKRGMRRGTMDTFEKIGNHIKKCASSRGYWC